MPAPTAEALSTAAKQHFSAQGIKLPMNWQEKGPLFPGAFGPPELSTPSNASTTLYHEPTQNKYHTGAARSLSRAYEKYIDGICAAISNAIDKWMKIASVVSVNVVGPVGTLLPGGVSGPALYPMIMAEAPQTTESDRKYSRAVAAAVSDNWFAWQQGLSGVLNYPGFTGAPMPNTPAPLITFASEPEPGLAAHKLSGVMQRNLNDSGALHAPTLFASVANAFFTHFQVFKTATVVSGVTVIAAAPPPVAPDADGAPDAADEPAAEDAPIGISATSIDDPENDPESETDESVAEEELLEAEEIEPEAPPEPVPCLVGMVIPTPGNFI